MKFNHFLELSYEADALLSTLVNVEEIQKV